MKFAIFSEEYLCRINNLYIVFCLTSPASPLCECDTPNCAVSDQAQTSKLHFAGRNNRGSFAN